MAKQDDPRPATDAQVSFTGDSLGTVAGSPGLAVRAAPLSSAITQELPSARRAPIEIQPNQHARDEISPYDTHPTASAQRAIGTWIARELLPAADPPRKP